MAKKIIIPYAPHAGQEIIHSDTHRYKTIVCGRRWGKTIAAVNHEIKEGIEKPGEYWLIGPTYRQMKLIAWEFVKQFAVPEIRRKLNEQELSITLINGSHIRLIGADNPENLRGKGLNGCIFDEYADIKRNVWPSIVRPMLTESKGWAWFMGTPKGKLNHLYEQFIRDRAKWDAEYIGLEGQAIEPDSDYKSFTFKSIESPYIDPVEIDKARKELSPEYFRQEYEASFENYTGIVYKELQDDQFVPITLQKHWNYFVGIDTGRHTAVDFIGLDENNSAWCFDEIYDYDGIVKDICKQIQMKCAQYHIEPRFIIDSASQVKREYQENGIFCLDSEKDVLNSIATIRSRLKAGLLHFDKARCRITAIQHKGYIWSKKLNQNGQPQPIKENDHTVNAVQYVLNHSAILKPGSPKAKAYRNTIEYHTINRPAVKLDSLG